MPGLAQNGIFQSMAKKHKKAALNDVLETDVALLKQPMAHITLKDLRRRAGQTQEELAAALGVGQDTISRLEKRSDMLLSTLRHYVESDGGELTLVAKFPNQTSLIIDYSDNNQNEHKKRGRKAELDSP